MAGMNEIDASYHSQEEDDDKKSDKCMKTISRHFFSDESEKSSFSISVIEVLCLIKLEKKENKYKYKS